ncbi:MAG: DUF1707 SHOCT-like domain-containing protein [Trebonia sp.]
MAGEVSPLGRGDEVASQDDLRASHEDRDRVVEVLRVAAGDGRLTAEELDERLERALTARTFGELATLIRDLPAAPDFVTGEPVPAPKDLASIDCQSSVARRGGGWLVPQRMEVRATSGSVTLDFTEAVISRPTLLINADMRSSSLRLVTKPGVLVDTDDVVTRSSTIKVRSPRGSQVPVVLRIQVSGKLSSSTITARPPRRTFWQWLRRQRP